MKTLKFKQKLADLILTGEKTSSWRLFDDKNLSVGDEVQFLVKETGEEFANAKLTKVKVTELGELTDEDKKGHEVFVSEEEMYRTFSGYYRRPVDAKTQVKIIWFELIS